VADSVLILALFRDVKRLRIHLSRSGQIAKVVQDIAEIRLRVQFTFLVSDLAVSCQRFFEHSLGFLLLGFLIKKVGQAVGDRGHAGFLTDIGIDGERLSVDCACARQVAVVLGNQSQIGKGSRLAIAVANLAVGFEGALFHLLCAGEVASAIEDSGKIICGACHAGNVADVLRDGDGLFEELLLGGEVLGFSNEGCEIVQADFDVLLVADVARDGKRVLPGLFRLNDVAGD
jgi:hypothetical protein